MRTKALSRLAALAAVLAASALAACGQPQTPPPVDAPQPQPQETARPKEESRPTIAGQPQAAPVVTLGAADDGRAVSLQRGEVVEVKLEADRASGFSWIPAQSLLPFMGTDGLPVYEEPAGAGAPGLETWRFIGLEPGHAHLVFEYRRPLAPDAPPQKTLTFHFDIE
jgi:predicted secreted protein/predicted small lipoprotein YifL